VEISQNSVAFSEYMNFDKLKKIAVTRLKPKSHLRHENMGMVVLLTKLLGTALSIQQDITQTIKIYQ
jgi:hypothetical protein